MTLAVISFVTCLVPQGSSHDVASSKSYSWGTIDPRVGVAVGGAESGIALCFFGHSQLLTEASQEAVKFKRTVPFMLTKSMTMTTLGETLGEAVGILALSAEAGGRIGGPRARPVPKWPPLSWRGRPEH